MQTRREGARACASVTLHAVELAEFTSCSGFGSGFTSFAMRRNSPVKQQQVDASRAVSAELEESLGKEKPVDNEAVHPRTRVHASVKPTGNQQRSASAAKPFVAELCKEML